MTTEERLKKLELELSETKEILASWTTQKIIRANTLMVKDDQGKPRATLSSSGLVLLDEKGINRITLNVIESEPGLVLSDNKGIDRAILGITETGPSLFLLDDKGDPRAGLAVTENGPALTV
jgi:hypothetical protein